MWRNTNSDPEEIVFQVLKVVYMSQPLTWVRDIHVTQTGIKCNTILHTYEYVLGNLKYIYNNTCFYI